MFTRNVVRSFLCVALVAVIASGNVAEGSLQGETAFFGNLLSGFTNSFSNSFGSSGFGGIAQSLTSQIADVTESITGKFSVLSSFFGEGASTDTLSLPQIFNGVFSRNNSMLFTNGTTIDMDNALGSGGGVLAFSNGGGVAVSSNGGSVSVSFGNAAPSPSRTPTPSPSPAGSPASGGDGDGDGDGPAGEGPLSASPEATVDEDEQLDDAVLDLMSDWDAFVTSDLWAAQDPEEPEASAEAEAGEDDVSLPATGARILNGVFLGNSYAAGAPFSVRFFYNNEENFYCSGSLIAYNFVLTAAHCGVVRGDEVRVGGRLLRSGFKATAGEVINHPDFKTDSLVHDVAIVKLKGLPGRKKLNKGGVFAARLNKKKKFPTRGFVGVVSGHGSTQTDGRGVSDELVSTRHTARKWKTCKEGITQGKLKAHDSYMCAGDGERSTTCVGDSGAGLWRFVTKGKKDTKKGYYEIYGVVSFGEVTDEKLCPLGPPTVFQRTSKNYGWIKAVVGKKKLP